MNRYTFCFIGREVGSLGNTHKCWVKIDAPTLAEAESKLYETHEHITHVATFMVALPDNLE